MQQDSGEGPSVPRFRLARSVNSHQTRLSLVNDIEEIDSDSYMPSPRPLSADSLDSTGLQWTPPISPSSRDDHSRSQSFDSLNPPFHYIHRSLVPDLRESDEDDQDDNQIGQISIVRPTVRQSLSALSSHSAMAMGGSTRSSSSASVLPIQIMDPADPPTVPSLAHGKAREHRPTDIDTSNFTSSTNLEQPMLRSLSAHTASSYAMYTPRSPAASANGSSKQVRFSHMPPGEVPPLPPHAQDALAHARLQQEQQARFFHGPPPLHGDDVLPPPYGGARRGTDRNQGSADNEKGATAIGPDGQKLPWWKRRGKLFWILLAIGILIIIFGAVVGAVVGVKASKTNSGSSAVVVSTNGTNSDFPPPEGFVGTWSFVTNLTSASSACAPAPIKATQDLWRCYPFQNPPSSQSVTWSFIIGDTDNGATSSSASDNTQLTISSADNPFTLDFEPQLLNLTRTLTNAYYEFSYPYSKTTLVSFGSSVAECEFPNSIFSGELYVNNSIFSTSNSLFQNKNVQSDDRGNWPGNVMLQEAKNGGGGQILCRDRATQNVINLGDLTTDHGDGNCLCGYTNF